MSEWENPLGVVWMVPQPERRRALRWPPGSGSVNFALAPRVTAAVLVAALAGGPAFAGAAYADPAHPTINLPPTTGGEANGDDDIPDGAPAPEDQPEPAAPATPDPAPAVSDPAPAAPGPQTAAPDPPPAPPAADAAPAPADAAPLAASPQPAAPDPAPAAADPAPAAADPAPAAADPAPPAAPDPAPPAAPDPAPPAAPDPAPAAPDASPPPAAAPPAGPPPASDLPAAPAAAAVRTTPPLVSSQRPRRARRHHHVSRVPARAARPVATLARSSATVPARSTATMPSRARAAGVPPAPGRLDGYVAAGTYTTRPGDSLWAIARRALGPQAAAARVNSLVWALWEANRDAIGTGNPNVLPVAVTLTLLKETA